MQVFTRTRQWYVRNERRISSIALFTGFITDSLTLRRVDRVWENTWVTLHLLGVAICILLMNYWHEHSSQLKDSARAHFWITTILQFFYGGLLSAFLVLYFRSAELSVTWPFILLLATTFIANERLKEYYARLTVQIGLFFLSLYSFAIFLVPVFLHRIGTDIFLISGFASLLIMVLFLWALGLFSSARLRHTRLAVLLLVAGIYGAITGFYFLNLIPPLPLALKDAGIYHNVERDGEGNYIADAEDIGWFGYFVPSDTFHAVSGDIAYAYTAIFSPARFTTDVVHEWQTYNEKAGAWQRVFESHLLIAGGRDGGFRTYSFKENITPGRWRVNVKTLNGKVIARLRFKVVEASEEPAVTTITKN